MSLLAANWLAAVALVAGASLFFLLPLLKAEWENLAIGGLALQAIASFFLFAEASVSPLLIAVGVLLAWVYHRTILRSILKQGRELSSTQKDEFLVGARGRVMAAIGRSRHGAGQGRALDGPQQIAAGERHGDRGDAARRLGIAGGKAKREEEAQ